MRAIEFEADISSTGQLPIPEEAAEGLPAGTRARVIILIPDGDDMDSATWDRFAAGNITDYYTPEDAVYDDYPRG